MSGYVRLCVDEGVATILMDRPRRNVVDVEFAEELHAAAVDAARRDDVRAVVIWGGERIFTVGGDIAVMAARSVDGIRPVVSAVGDAVAAIEAIPKVVIAAVNGLCLGAGTEIALAADFRYAATTALFGQPEISFGIMPGAGATQRLPRLIGRSAAKDMIFSGRRVKAREALAMGLVDRVLEPCAVYAAAVASATAYAAGPLAALGAAKAAIDARDDAVPQDGLDLERDLFCDLFQTEDQKEGMRAFLENRKPAFKGR